MTENGKQEQEVPYADVNGQRLYYEDTGGAGPAIVFSHGLLLDGTMFSPQVMAFRDRYRCIVWDERGHGKTATETLPTFSYYDSANDLSALLSFLGIDSAILVGVSQGSFLGMRCALTHPERVRALVLIATQAGVDDPTTLASYRALLGAWIAGKLPDEIATTVEHIIFGPNWPGASAWKEKWRAMTAPNLLSCLDTLARRDDISDKISSIRVPTLVIHGDADAAIPLSRAQAMKAAIPNAELILIAGGHSVNMTNPGPVNAAIKDFLERHPLVS
ncbi:alpha/beta fold hydrolase [Bradyrhizobium neotropicale]|uniref:alpha/beta fold hydrolase n=1 Tax=Bradyrhizobium neotropicale TaxID=1497615 RepID=UPI001AD6338F|nr:alpha/beta hydrolase [Bradyrhizobium neotropicale]